MADRNPKYNGRVGVYRTNEIENFIIQWSPASGPTPTNWYDASTNNFTIDRISTSDMTFIGTQGPTLSYTTTKNGYAVATATSSITLTADNISTRYVTQFLISQWNSTFELSYTINPNSTGPGGGSNYNSGKIKLSNTGTASIPISQNTLCRAVFSYAGSYPTETYPNAYKSTLVPSGYNLISLTADLTSGPQANLWLNSATQSTGGFNDALGYGLVNDDQLRIAASNCILAELIQYDSVLSKANINLVESYLKSKWGL